jgi:type VI secretion system protein ImpE
MPRQDAEQAVRDGDPAGALRLLQDEVRRQPADASLRIFLFQLLCVNGEWERALTQLNVAADLDASALGMAQMYREAIRCEVLRREVFEGKRSPVVFGQPDEWIALLVEALQAAGAGRDADARALRGRAFEAAPASAGAVDGTPFEWIADSDMRLGPICEAVINGHYYWVPWARLARLEIDAPADLRDVVWMPARFFFANGGDAVGVIPTRYPGSEVSSDALIRLARKTIWDDDGHDSFTGAGQRMLTTSAGEHSLMDVRAITIDVPAEAGEQAPTHA